MKKQKWIILVIFFVMVIVVFVILKYKKIDIAKIAPTIKQTLTEKFSKQQEQKETKPNEEREIFVHTFKANEVYFEDKIEGLLGTVKGSSFEIKVSQDERILRYNYRRGQAVSKGVVIAELDHNRTLQKLKQAQSNYDRTKKLYELGGATSYQMKEAEASISLAQQEYQETYIKAPEDGYIGEIIVEEGELAVRNSAICTFVSKEKLFRVDSSIIERRVNLIKKGDKVKINIEALPEAILDGEIISIAPEATTASRMVPIAVSIPEMNNSKLKPGLSARLTITIFEKQCIVIPKSAIDYESSAVFVVNEETKASLRNVVLGYHARDYVEIISGLNDGDVIIEDYLKSGIEDGSKVIYNAPEEYGEKEEKKDNL